MEEKRLAINENRLAINQKEFAERIGMSVISARELMNREGFPTIRVGRVRLIPLAALETWMEKQAEQGR